MDELLNELMSPTPGKEGWSTCSLCGVKIKTKNLHEHMAKVHPVRQANAEKPID